MSGSLDSDLPGRQDPDPERSPQTLDPTGRLLEGLESAYRLLDQALSTTAQVNACGTCRACCTAAGLTRHVVTDLELAYLARKRGPKVAEQMQAYAERTVDETGNLRYPECPHYDEALAGCGIYSDRPFACRVFGPYHLEGTRLPESCVFGTVSQSLTRPGYYALPGASDLRRLTREFLVFRPVLSGRGRATGPEGGTPDLSFLNLDDPVDRALALQARGDFGEALVELQSVPGDPTPFAMVTAAMLLSLLDRHEEAWAGFARAAESLPERADLQYYAGYHALMLGRGDLGRAHLERAIELVPEYALALGFLGYHYLMAGSVDRAADYLERAVGADPENGFFRLRLAGAWLHLGQSARARTHLEAACRFAPTEVEARALLARLGA